MLSVIKISVLCVALFLAGCITSFCILSGSINNRTPQPHVLFIDAAIDAAATESLPDHSKWTRSATTVRAFSGLKTRHFPSDQVKFATDHLESAKWNKKLEPWCDKWGVVTTIFGVSEAVRRQVTSTVAAI